MSRKFITSVVRKHKDRARLGLKLAFDTGPKPKYQPKVSTLPSVLFDFSVVGLFVLLGLANLVWPR